MGRTGRESERGGERRGEVGGEGERGLCVCVCVYEPVGIGLRVGVRFG